MLSENLPLCHVRFGLCVEWETAAVRLFLGFFGLWIFLRDQQDFPGATLFRCWFEKTLQNGAKNLFLALEFPVDQRSRYGRLFGNIFERALRIAELQDAVARGIENDSPRCTSVKRFFCIFLNRYILYIICNTVTRLRMTLRAAFHKYLGGKGCRRTLMKLTLT